MGLGEIRSNATLGGRFAAEVDVIASPQETLDSACFRLRKPTADDGLPWLRQARLIYRKGPPAILEIRSDLPQYDPVLQVGVIVGCGHEVSRDFTLFLSPTRESAAAPQALPSVSVPSVADESDAAPTRRAAPHRPRPEAVAPRVAPPPPRERPKHRPLPLPDRLVLSGGAGVGAEGGAGEASLRMATELSSWRGEGGGGVEAQRELLRLEFRTLLALNSQADNQLSAAEKLRNLEANLAELKLRTEEVAQRIEQQAAEGKKPAGEMAGPPAQPATPVPMTQAPAAPATPKVVVPRAPVADEEDGGSWAFYGLLGGALLALGGFLGWREYQRRQTVDDDTLAIPEPIPDPQRDDEFEERGGVDLRVEPSAMGMAVDLHLGEDEPAPAEVPAAPVKPVSLDSQFSVSAATVDEHFEANPVMELAEIMLSFGRVKGAAQALQDFIDNNPDEALQPWIRLLDVYRMAGMQDEFQKVAEDLNKHFNVEVQRWDLGAPELIPADNGLSLVPQEGAAAPKAQSIEELPHVCKTLNDLWKSEEVIDYLHRLLRDNRGGKRSGFTLDAVHEILFLIELKETLLVMEKEAQA